MKTESIHLVACAKTRFVKIMCCLFALIACVVFAVPVVSAAQQQKMFATPEAAVKALISAVKTNNEKALLVLLGPGADSIISSGDPVADQFGRESFVKAYDEKHWLADGAGAVKILHVGNKDYPMPIPIARKGKMWFFDTEAGKEEILCRRIGRNELNAIDVLREYAHAQREYAAKDRNADGVLEYAQKLSSTPGRKDGLYWEAAPGQEESPFGPLVAKAATKGYTPKAGEETPNPYRGYFFRILTMQGPHAGGGAYEYIANGRMILGFAMVAYPAHYGTSGVMTFIVNQEGIVYQKDLGSDTEKVATEMTAYDPDTSWKKAE
ncbi:MAG TPA: DUF2950 domain-containing protein [Dissulfurispiraceae bacterium]|nr:DUF2950 domain-containing protein [Dissulfurispiraceae bacterium]